MTGFEYEQFVRAVICRTLNIAPDKLQTTHSPRVTLPNASGLDHQIDLFYVDETKERVQVLSFAFEYCG